MTNKRKGKDLIRKSSRTFVLYESVQHTGPGGTEWFNVSSMNSIRISLQVQNDSLPSTTWSKKNDLGEIIVHALQLLVTAFYQSHCAGGGQTKSLIPGFGPGERKKQQRKHLRAPSDAPWRRLNGNRCREIRWVVMAGWRAEDEAYLAISVGAMMKSAKPRFSCIDFHLKQFNMLKGWGWSV